LGAVSLLLAGFPAEHLHGHDSEDDQPGDGRVQAELGYLTRSPDPTDRRKVIVSVTEEAKTKAWQIYGPIAEEGAANAENYTEAELRLLIGFLRSSREFQERHRRRIQELP
jgi:hypothetical protein